MSGARMVKQSENIVHRLFDRQVSNRPSGTQLHSVRRLYENIVPGHTVYDVDCPEYAFRKFSNDGQYLVAFNRNWHDVAVFKFNWMNYSFHGDESDELPPKAKRFESFFTQLYSVRLGSESEKICKDFFLSTEDSAFGIFATATPPLQGAAPAAGAIPGIPASQKISIFVVRLADGSIIDERVYRDDFINLSTNMGPNMGLFMHEDLLAVLSIRYQRIHILQIRDTGMLLDVRTIGDYCREDDQLLVNIQEQKETAFRNTYKRAKEAKAPVDLKESETMLVRHLQHQKRAANHHPVTGLYRVGDVLSRSRNGSLSSLGLRSSTDARYPNSSYSVNNNHTYISNTDSSPNYVISSRERVASRSAAASAVAAASGAASETGPVSSSGSRQASSSQHRSLDSNGVVSSSIVREASMGSLDVGAILMSSNANTASGSDLGAGAAPEVPQEIPAVAVEPTFGASSLEQRDGAPSTRIICGIKQRLMSFIYKTHLGRDNAHLRTHRFYFLFQGYVDLVMWKMQFLDRHHLLIKFGSVDGVLSRASEASQQTAFFVVYNFETTEVLEFQQNSSEELVQLFENFFDHFRVSPGYPASMRYITSCSNNMFVREQIRKQRSASRPGNSVQANRRALSLLPFKPQCHTPSPYFDHSLFQFDEKLISASDRHRPCVEHPIKFISRRRPNALKFKISAGPEAGASDGRMKRVAAATFIFHPIFPFAMSIQASYPPHTVTVVNFHFRK